MAQQDDARQGEEKDNEFRRVRLEKLEALQALGVDPYPHKFAPEHQATALEQRYTDLPAGKETTDRVKLAGRIRAIRNSGMFIDLHDASGKIQIFSHKDFLSPEQLQILRL